MASDADVSVDREHYDCIIETARDVRHLTKLFDKLDKKVDGIDGRISSCPCPAVKDLQKDVSALKTQNAYTTGKLAGIVAAVSLAANYIAPYLFGRS